MNPSPFTIGIEKNSYGRPKKMVLVVTGSHNEFRNFCHENRVAWTDRRLVEITRSLQLRGYQNMPVVVYGRWFENDALYAAVEEYCARNGLTASDLPSSL